MRTPVLALPVPLALTLALAAVAHDDDGKRRDNMPPWSGPGHRPAAALAQLLEGTPAGLGEETGTGSIQFPRKGVELLSWLPPAWLHPECDGTNDCWGYVSPSGTEYAIVGLRNGTSFVSLADPSAPQVVGFVDGNDGIWRDVKTFGEYAYIVSESSGGIQVVDLQQIDAGVVTLVNTVTDGGPLDSHNVAIDEVSGFLYRCGGTGRGLRFYDLNADPVDPPYVGSWNSRYVHDAQVVTYTTGPYAGRQIAFCCGGLNNGSSATGLYVVDVTNKGWPYTVDYASYSNSAYSHQGWLTADRQYFLLDDELDEGGSLKTRTIVMDVSDLSNVFEATTFKSKARSIGHNLYVRGDQAFEANYRAGLRVFDVADPLDAKETAWFDTWPGDDQARFNSLWSNYPFFPSGIVIGSDIEKGLFVWWVGEPQVAFEYPQGRPQLVGTGGQSVEVRLTEAAPGDLALGSERLYVDMGAGVMELPLVDLGGGDYRADLPPAAVGQDVRWFLGARSTSGALWTSPPEAPFTNWWAVGGDGALTLFEDDCEVDSGWTVGSSIDTANQGVWVLGDPEVSDSSPGDDHTPGGTNCWHTGANTSLSGKTTLTSPRLDLTGVESPVVEFWYWFSDGSNIFYNPVDKLFVRLSVDDGATWNQVEALRANDPQEGAWRRYSFALGDVAETSDAVRLSFRAQDLQVNDMIEAAIDDVRVWQPYGGCDWSSACETSPNSAGSGATLSASGSASLAANDLVLRADGAPPGEFGLFFYGPDSNDGALGDGVLCIGGGLHRLPALAIDGAGVGTWALDMDAPPKEVGRIEVGSEWRFQLWYRDTAGGGSGSNTSDALVVRFCP